MDECIRPLFANLVTNSLNTIMYGTVEPWLSVPHVSAPSIIHILDYLWKFLTQVHMINCLLFNMEKRSKKCLANC